MTLDLGLGTHHDASPTRLIGIFHTLQTVDEGAGWEVWSLDILHQSFGINLRIVDIGTATIDHLTQVMCRDIGGHTYSDTITTVHQQVRDLGRHDTRLCERIIEVVHHVNGVLLQVVHDMLAHLGEAALGVSHGSCRVTVNTTEVTLSVNQRIAHIPVLRHTNQGAIDGAVAVGVVLT